MVGGWVLEACLQYDLNFGIKEDQIRPQRLHLIGWFFSDDWHIQGTKTIQFWILYDKGCFSLNWDFIW